MARQKKDAKNYTFYLSREISTLLDKFCEETGLAKTVAVERFIAKGIREYNNQEDIRKEKGEF